MPDQQRRGAGTAVTRAVIEDGIRRGAVSAMLQSSPAGRPVYERIGFHDVGSVTVMAGRFGRAAPGEPG
jgi:predicted GNAT family acetyltransferase